MGAVVATWFRHRVPDDSADSAPGNAAWPPLRPIAEPSDGAPAEPAPMPPDTGQETWVAPADDGSCPLHHPIKAKASSGIYHEPDGLAYERTNADRCYASIGDAAADGYRASKI